MVSVMRSKSMLLLLLLLSVVVALVGVVNVVVVEDIGVVAAAAVGVDVSVDVGSIAVAAKSAGVACAVLVSGDPVSAVVACACKFVKVSIKGRAYIAASVFIPFLPPIIVVTDDSRPFSGSGIVSLCRCVRACGRLRLFPFP